MKGPNDFVMQKAQVSVGVSVGPLGGNSISTLSCKFSYQNELHAARSSLTQVLYTFSSSFEL